MFQSLILILLLIALFWGIAKFKKMPPAAARKLLVRSGIGALVLVLIMMAITGRMHWLFALIGALIPFTRGLLGIGVQLLPFWLKRRQGPQDSAQTQQQHQQAAARTDMSVKEAMDILGLSGAINGGDITSANVNDAHRRLIQKVHPDRGGNDYLAAKINHARDVLLKAIS
jgi:hypothetical protein